MEGFDRRLSLKTIEKAMLSSAGINLTNEELERIRRYHTNWDFYEGFHWQDIPEDGTARVTENYVRKFADTFTAFETGGGFSVHMQTEAEKVEGDNNPLNFIEDTWKENGKLSKLIELGQSRSVTGDAWVQVSYDAPDSIGYDDPFGEFPKGKIRINVLPSVICFPEYSEDQQRKEDVERFTILYPVERQTQEELDKLRDMSLTQKAREFFSSRKKTDSVQRIMFAMTWDKEFVSIRYGDEEPILEPNPYGVIPFRQIKNFPVVGKNFGANDIEDIIPLNVELNMKKSNISEIIDYHSAPVTLIFGARVSTLERGANKLWGGLPEKARVENLRLEGDLNASQSYIEGLKTAMSEIGNIPKGALGGDMGISNTSAPALHMYLLPLLERIKVKQELLREGIIWLNKLILHVGKHHGMIEIPETMNSTEDKWKFFYNTVEFGDILPKDRLMELQQVEIEMRLGLADRKEAMQRLKKQNVDEHIAEIDADIKKNPKLYGQEDIEEQIAMLKEQQDMKAIPGEDPNVKKVGENKDGKPKQINSGVTNSQQKKVDSSKPTPSAK